MIADARLWPSYISVWAIIGYWRAVGQDADRTARDYDISPDEVAAAIAYYRRHQAIIDARLAENEG